MFATKSIALLSFIASSLLVNGSPLLESPERSVFLFGGGGNSCPGGTEFDWSYNTDCTIAANNQVAPADWGLRYPFCSGTRQTPINIRSSSLSTNCAAAPFSSRVFQFNNGMCMFNSLKLDISPKGWTVKFKDNCSVTPHAIIDGTQYDLLEFHLHSLSEHAYSGQFFDAELHLVHVNVNDPNDLVVIGVNLVSDFNSILNISLGILGITIGTGSGEPANAELNNYLTAFAAKAGGRKLATGADFQVMPYNMLPSDRGYFNYLGSLTTPPCNEIVTWVVMKEAITITSSNLGAFRDSLTDQDFPITSEDGNNNRPLQPLNGRTVYSCTMA